MWQEEGLRIPHVIEKDTAAYRKEEDIIGMFLDEQTLIGDDGRTSRKEAYIRYCSWIRDSGMKPLSRPNFNRKMMDKGYKSTKVSGFEHWEGFTLIEDICTL
jgi:putative DNA primase/helicase